jgi:hypothetical protein
MGGTPVRERQTGPAGWRFGCRRARRPCSMTLASINRAAAMAGRHPPVWRSSGPGMRSRTRAAGTDRSRRAQWAGAPSRKATETL